jgi:sodium/hydrogen antiporter
VFTGVESVAAGLPQQLLGIWGPPMELAALCLTLVAIVLWAGISTRAAVISTPIFFVAVGLVLAEGLHLFDVETDSHQVKIIAEVALVWVLFADASRIRISDLRADLGRCIRLLDSAFR